MNQQDFVEQYQLISPKHVAELFDTSRIQVMRLVDYGVLPEPMRFSDRTVRWHQSDILEAIEKYNQNK